MFPKLGKQQRNEATTAQQRNDAGPHKTKQQRRKDERRNATKAYKTWGGITKLGGVSRAMLAPIQDPGSRNSGNGPS